MSYKIKTIITGGGTAGHITPAISIAKALEENHNVKITYFGNGNYLEKEIAEKEKYPFIHIDSQGMEGKNFADKWSKFIFKNSKGVFQCLKEIKKIKPDLIVSTGGFVSAPVLAAANILNIPFFIHEQNTVLGRVNKLFLKKATEVFLSFEDTIGFSSIQNGKVFGNPVSINEKTEEGNDIVILGGSGGSDFLNNWALSFAESNPSIPIHLQAGRKNVEELTRKANEKSLSNLTIYGFINIEEIYKKAKFTITRGGTSTLFELANAEIPSIVIPLPNSMDNHQYMNGKYFERLGVADVIEQKEQNEKNSLDLTALEWWNNKKKIDEKREKFKSFTYKNCSNLIAEQIISHLKK